MQIKLGERMRELRRRDSRTQEDLARALGVTAQAVSRWEKNTCYPDMEIIPSIANYFGVSIDELFGYQGERAKKIGELSKKITEMNRQNNGVDVCVDECIRLAREGLVEFPGNDKLMLCLASVLANAGYVRYGEYHLTDPEGYDIFDVERHRGYEEWREAISLYEKLLETTSAGDVRNQAMRELIHLYATIGELEKAAAVAENVPEIIGSREMLMLNACDGKKRAEAYGETLLKMVGICSHLMTSCVAMNNTNLDPKYAAQIVKNAIAIFDFVCTDGNYGLYNSDMIGLNLYLSEHLWRSGDRDGAFDALYTALGHARNLEELCEQCGDQDEVAYTAPLIKSLRKRINKGYVGTIADSLPNDWPWWFVPDCSDVKAEITADPRWDEWVKATQSK